MKSKGRTGILRETPRTYAKHMAGAMGSLGECKGAEPGMRQRQTKPAKVEVRREELKKIPPGAYIPRPP